uniref:Uncharacterized protein n=1 Tax=Ascaris lumbricoides TaxID=6252 RepID=A0A0M3I8T9_ASCLU
MVKPITSVWTVRQPPKTFDCSVRMPFSERSLHFPIGQRSSHGPLFCDCKKSFLLCAKT